jgi:hypothetical protein
MTTRKDRTEEDRRETEIRHMNELLQELRVILPGVQVTFAFLLTVAFMEPFSEATWFQRSVYFTALVSTGVATAFFIAPTVQHRILWRQGERPLRLKIGNGLFNRRDDLSRSGNELRDLFGRRCRVRESSRHHSHRRNGRCIRCGMVPVTSLPARTRLTFSYTAPRYRLKAGSRRIYRPDLS